MSLPLWCVDAFTGSPFRGNPAGVCLLDSPRPDSWMAALAAELGAPETAFLLPDGDAYRLRWFTPLVEVPLCGHATLAAAHVLFQRGLPDGGDVVKFLTLSDTVSAARHVDRIELDFPLIPVREHPLTPELQDALGVAPTWVGITADRQGREVNYLCILADDDAVRAVRPDMARLRQLPASVIVSARSSGDHAIVSRYFAPAVGIDEDPVTGSAHCALAHYWAPRLGLDRFLAWQASPRGGEIEVTVRGDRVGLAGHAVTIWSGACLV